MWLASVACECGVPVSAEMLAHTTNNCRWGSIAAVTLMSRMATVPLAVYSQKVTAGIAVSALRECLSLVNFRHEVHLSRRASGVMASCSGIPERQCVCSMMLKENDAINQHRGFCTASCFQTLISVQDQMPTC